EIIRKFHKLYKKNIFVEPKPILTAVPKLVGIDNRKMSKSYNNSINLSDSQETLKKKVFSMYTDPKRTRADIPGKVEGNPVFIYHDLFNRDLEQVKELKKRYQAGGVGDVEVKDKLYQALNRFLEPIRQKRESFSDLKVQEILVKGTEQAALVAKKTMTKVKTCLHLG
ncbi:MAG: tryptophan--tRNA ligase, partial [Candidatus Omnitrophica bacterium]|nr:tryptophan--tRNA ligase [Candidatus Omnitrophota bacterium]